MRKAKKKATKQANEDARLITSGPPIVARGPPETARADSDVWLPAPKLRKLLGGISPVTFWRWRHNAALAPPPGRRINGRWYFNRQGVSDWHARQAAAV
jgi:hypothetical protein